MVFVILIVLPVNSWCLGLYKVEFLGIWISNVLFS